MSGLSLGPILEFLKKDDVATLSQFLDCDKVDVDEKDEDGWTGLFYAVTSNKVEFVSVLLEKGAYPNRFDNQSRTPLFEAVTGNNLEIVTLLIDAGAEIELKAIYKST